MPKKIKSKRPEIVKPHVMIDHCTFSGAQESPGVVAVAEALKANAEALRDLAKHLTVPQCLLTVNPPKSE